MKAQHIESAADRLKAAKEAQVGSELYKAAEQTAPRGSTAVGEVIGTVKSTKSAKIAQGDEGRSANGE